MAHSLLIAVLLRSVSSIANPGVANDAPAPRDPALAPAAEFVLESTRGERVSLYAEREGRVATAVVFLTEDCPVAKLYAPKVGKLAAEYADQGIVFLAVDASPGTDKTKAEAFAKSLGLELPLLLDPMQAVAARYEVKHAATALLLDREFNAVYRGSIDDQYTLAEQKPHPSNEWLVEAIEATIAGEDVADATTEVSGTPLAPETAAKKGAGAQAMAVTFNEHVAPILYSQCADCHRPGQVGPMALLDYDDAKGWANQIAEVVEQGRMPPWHADPRYGRFENERRLTDTEKAVLVKWAATGAKQGESKHKPKPPVFKDDGWAMGKPDLIVQIPKPQPIPAEGVVQYRYVFGVEIPIKEEKWVQAVEIRPTALEATHHVLAFYVPPGKAGMTALSGLQDGSLIGAGYFAVQVPGCRPNLYPEGTGKKIEPGGTFVFQLHYTPNGKKLEDQTRIGLRFCESKPEIEMKTMGVFSQSLRIPPHEEHAVATASHTFRKPVRVISMFPHMHTRGSAFKFERLSGPKDEETRTIVCDVPKYDFNWQNFYLPEGGIRFEAGEKMFCTAVYNNSKSNPFNPDPNKFVTWGDQTFEEMMIGYLDYVEEQ